MNTELKAQCQHHFIRLIKRGVPILAFDCPSCNTQLLTTRPGIDQEWETLSTCWRCDCIFLKMSDHHKVRTQIPPHLNNAKQ
ncbi:hypothetical protein ABZP26_08285 [Pseudoalteromonas sp. SD03]|jgi:hypothetical protein|uniref:Uncharacterized protein n=1 Tax=Pseudoalteromonas sp. SD03 TaxID=3231719 RepID=A0AB39AL37_9GAMM